MADDQKISLATLKRVLIENTGPGKRWTRRGLSLAASEGRNADVVRDILRGSSDNPKLETVAGIANALNLDLSGFLESRPTFTEGPEFLSVNASVAAGVWREQTDWPASRRYTIEVGPNKIPGSERFAVELEGLSMDKVIPPNSVLECARVAFGSVEPAPGDLVVVERQRHDLTEMTCKRLGRDENGWFLKCESSQPEFQDIIRLGNPDNDLWTDDEVRVVGIVIEARQRHFKRR